MWPLLVLLSFIYFFPTGPLSACSIVRSYFAFAAKWHQNAVVACRLPVVAVAISSVWLVLNNLPHALSPESYGATELWIRGLGLTWSLSHISHAAAITAATYCCCSCCCCCLPACLPFAPRPQTTPVSTGWKNKAERSWSRSRGVGAAVSAALKCFINT